MNSPRWVATIFTRATHLSPLPNRSSTSARMSGNADRSIPKYSSAPCLVGGMPGVSSCSQRRT